MSLRLPDRALLVKLFNQNDISAIVALRKFRTLKGMQKGPLTAINLQLMITKFEETGSLNVRSGRGRKPVSAETIEKVALQVEEDKASNVQASIYKCSLCSRSFGSASFNCPEDHAKHSPLLSIQASTCAGIAST
ncbi:hypothetical protein TNCV_4249851 [Trichonephila clavipes]|nr:hypothetical protein TNCV_4249851 [Trichonephila clavipes]